MVTGLDDPVARYDFLLACGVRPGDIWRAVQVSKRQIEELRHRGADLAPSVAANVAAKLHQFRVKDALARRLADRLDYGWTAAALARDLKVPEDELARLRDGALDLDDDEAAKLLQRLSWSRWQGLNGLGLSVRGYLQDGFTPAALDRWLGWEDGNVDRLVAGSLDLADEEIILARERLYDIPPAKVLDLETGTLVEGLAFDRASADAAERWWVAFEDVDARGLRDWSPLAESRDVVVSLVREGECRRFRLPDDRDGDRLAAVIAARRAVAERRSRREELEALFRMTVGSEGERF